MLSLLLLAAAHRHGMAATNMAAMRIEHKTEYWGTIGLGTPVKEFTVIFDTGSGNLIVPGSNCTSQTCLAHKRYSTGSSSTSRRVTRMGTDLDGDPKHEEGTIKFGTGKVHGTFVNDHLCLAPTSCAATSFIAASQETEEPFADCDFDGILGLGFVELSMSKGFNVLTQLDLPKPQVLVYLSDTTGSSISFGGVDPSLAASAFVWVPVTKASYWQIGIDDITFNSDPTGLCHNCQVAVDTGTSLLAGPSDVIDQLTSKLNVKSDCSNLKELPMLGFKIGEKVLSLTPEDYVDISDGSCDLSLMALDVPPPRGPLFVFGDPFLRRFLTVYDAAGPRVGFAVAKQSSPPDPRVVAGLGAPEKPSFLQRSALLTVPLQRTKRS